MPSSPSNRRYRTLAWLAVIHALAITVFDMLMLVRGHRSYFEANLWIGVATLWLLWPVVLLLHAGRTAFRLGATICISLLLLVPATRGYRADAPTAFGLPMGVDLSPWAVRDYFASRRQGRADAESDLREGRLALEIWGLPTPTAYREMLQARGIELRHTAGCTEVTAAVQGHADGYNERAEREIKRRFGESFLSTAREKSYTDALSPDQI